jgi:hypothetical protein
MTEMDQSGSEGGVALTAPSLPLSYNAEGRTAMSARLGNSKWIPLAYW